MVKYIFLLLFTFQLMAQEDQVLSWYTNDPRNKEVVLLGEKGSIQYQYFLKGLLPDPYKGENEFAYSWMEDFKWEVKTNLEIEDVNAQYFFKCDWIDTYCSIYINDVLAYSAENAFLPHRFEISKFLKEGDNKIVAVFTPPVLFHKEEKQDFVYPAPNDIAKFKTSSLTRKPQYQFGWDWAPRMNTIGFIEPVIVEKNPKPTINHYQVVLHKFDGENASTEFFIECEGLENQKVVWESRRFGKQNCVVEQGKISRPEIIKNAKLWMPNNLGEQHIYEDLWELKNNDGELIAKKKVRFGLKSSELRYEEDQYGKAYYFLVNGKKVFCKGANYIPQDVFPSRITEKDIEKMVVAMAEANFNMVRVWGGGYYPMNKFYELCDSLGIMVWQDFMFACAMYPGDESFLKNVNTEAHFQVKRLAKHPSLFLFNGNNEVDVAWKNWGFQKEYNLDSLAQIQIEKEYDKLFKELLPKAVSYFSEVSYIHTSPLSNWGKPEFFNDGTMHYWGVWHGKDPIEDLWMKTGRFNAEYGFQAFPNFSTIHYFAEEQEQSLTSSTMKNHQKSYVGNGMIAKHADTIFGKSRSFEDFVYKSQLTQSLGIGNAIIAHRLNYPRCTGTLFWQLNDCWPAPTWSSLDVFMNKKALHYEVEKNYASISVVQNPNEELGNFWVINDSEVEGYVPIDLKIIELNGKVRFSTSLGLYFKSSDYKKSLGFNNLKALNKRKSYILILTWIDKSGKTYERRILKKGTKKIPTLKENQIEVLNTTYSKEKKSGCIVIEIGEFTQNLWLTSTSQHINFDRNFELLEKGKHTFTYHSEVELDLEHLKFFFLNKK